METNSKIYLPDGHLQTEEIIRDLQGIRTINNNPIVEISLRSVINKSHSLIENLNFDPRLPLHQIEKDMIELCKGKEYHGVHMPISFITKYPKRDLSNFGFLPVFI